MKTHKSRNAPPTRKRTEDPLVIREILELYNDGYTVHEIAQLQGLHCVAVAGIVSGAIEKDAAECA